MTQPMTRLNRLSRLLGGYADEQEQPHKTQVPAGPREKILMDILKEAAVFDYIKMFYNPIRRHCSNDGLSPVEFEK